VSPAQAAVPLVQMMSVWDVMKASISPEKYAPLARITAQPVSQPIHAPNAVTAIY